MFERKYNIVFKKNLIKIYLKSFAGFPFFYQWNLYLNAWFRSPEKEIWSGINGWSDASQLLWYIQLLKKIFLLSLQTYKHWLISCKYRMFRVRVKIDFPSRQQLRLQWHQSTMTTKVILHNASYDRNMSNIPMPGGLAKAGAWGVWQKPARWGHPAPIEHPRILGPLRAVLANCDTTHLVQFSWKSRNSESRTSQIFRQNIMDIRQWGNYDRGLAATLACLQPVETTSK